VSPRLAALLGYDPHRVADLRPELQRALALSALSAFPGIVLLAGSAAYGAFLASDVVGLSLAVGLGAGLYLLNLLRVAVAGGGVGPQQPLAEVTHWRPRTVPLVMLALLGLFFAQPLILGILSAEQDPKIEALRRSLATLHTAGVLRSVAEERTRATSALAAATARFERRPKNLADDKLEAQRADVERAAAAVRRLDEREAQLRTEDLEPYQRHLATSHFLLRRVQLTWDHPVRPVLLSALMVLLMVLPWFASATLARTATRAYEARRWKMNRALIDASYRESRRLEADALQQWPAFAGLRQELYEDAPYNTRARAGAGAFEARHG
jgi:hypothetical protein